MVTKDATLALFFTRGISLLTWEQGGNLEREIKPYIAFASHFKEIYLFTYGVNENKKYTSLFPKNVRIVSRPALIPATVYSFMLPYIQFQLLKRIDIIKTNQMDGSYAAIFAKKIFGKKVVVRCGYEWLNLLEKTGRSFLKRLVALCIEKFAYKNADKIIITSDVEKKFIMNRFKIKEEKIYVIPNYIDTNLFSPTATEKKQHSIVFVGRLESVKNLPNLIDALAGIQCSITLIGKGSQREALEIQARDHGIAISFKGTISQSDLPKELGNHGIFILPSFSEGNPKALLEAMACGLACIASDIPAHKEIIQHGLNGLLAATNNRSIKEKIQSLLEDKEIQIRLGEAARKTVVERFSFEKVISMELSLYASL